MIEHKQTAVCSIHASAESSHETLDSIQDTVESSQGNELFTQCKNYKVSLDLKVELEHIKLQVIKEIKNLLIKQLNIFKDSSLKSQLTVIQHIDKTTASCTKNKSYTYKSTKK